MFGWGKKKEKEVPKTGFVGDCSDEQEFVLQSFKDWVKSEGKADLESMDDYDYLRWCRARKFKIEDIQKMFNTHMEWRKTEDVDNIIENFDFKEKE